MRHLISVSLACLLGLTTAVASNANTINVPQQYSTIQAAVDHANAGDLIRVRGGVYHESVIIFNTYNIEIQGESGAAMVGTMVPAQAAINSFSPGNSIHGLTIRNYDVGLAASGSIKIYSNTVSNCNIGVYASVFGDGVSLPAPTSIDHNTVYQNGNGIVLDNSQNVTACQNTVYANGLNQAGPGITVEFSDHCTVTGNTVTVNGTGILAYFSSANSFTYNVAIGNQGLDADDEYGDGNVWAHNIFGPGKTSGI